MDYKSSEFNNWRPAAAVFDPAKLMEGHEPSGNSWFESISLSVSDKVQM